MALSKFWKADLLAWARLAGVRAAKTFGQALVGLIPAGACITEVTWPVMLGTAALAAVASLATSLAGLPELDDGASLPQIIKED